jgi:hypothetical protein
VGRFLTKGVPAYFLIALGIVVLMPYVLSRVTTLDSPRRDEGLGIQELITGVKDELTKTEKARREKGEAPLFELQSFDLEISFVVRASTKQSGGANYQVLTVDSALETGSEKIQKLRLHMTAVEPRAESAAASPGPPMASPQGGAQVLTPVPPKRGDRQ